MLRAVFLSDQPLKIYQVTAADVKDALEKKHVPFWLHIDAQDPEDFNVLRDIFDFHPLAVEDCQSKGYQPPKVDDFGNFLFLIVHALHPDHNLVELETNELNLFLNEKFLVTVINGSNLSPIEVIFHQIRRDERLSRNGTDFLCHGILDVLVDEYMPVIDSMDEEIESLEDQVLTRPNPKTMERILNLKHSIMTLRRIISPMREILNRLSRDSFPMIDEQSRIYFRDVYDHLVRIQDLTDTIRDIVSGTMDIYLNSTSLRLNEVMKALTIVSTIFLPLSFLAGVYGMNFEIMVPDIGWAYGFPFFVVFCIIVAASMLIWFKKRGWF